ncbi:malto-oligosyltrehalose synthase [Myxacorys almedinensis]|uniref:Malto-oligosyltrehalose synthase n=1 Tax=Myxacorys almedinensis A TaxID=2690445 RepID=A0A8J7Z492_9CYAN|nr:malto-oligosyltrehalose synthase [Myxacorys almedinensis]NDJ19702.1 malto-oligosyltrehalose synthase [Myxacorys almedinensis A]
MRIPTATYRIQFNTDFRFDQARNIVDYLSQLGISDLYASPIFKATTGSTHGYDVADPTRLNPELGAPESFDNLIEELQNYQMGWLQDIVPNHMAYSSENQWLMDLLENGISSDYVDYFDVAWNSPFESSKEPLLVPLLGNFYGESLENGEIQLKYNQDGLSVNYYSLSIPLNLESHGTFLTYNLGKLAKALGRRDPNFIKLLGILYLLKNVASEDLTAKQRQDQVDFVKGLLWEVYSDNAEVKRFVDENIQIFNGEAGNSESFNLLDNLLSQQFFRLAYWKVGAEEINYRRFFTVNELISMKVDVFKVFNHTHELIAQLVKDGKFTGLRIDHIDGLYDPTQYLHWLREKVGDTYITVEKILQPGENLPPVWDTQGTSGYDYLNYVNSLFCQTENEERFEQIYQNTIGFQASFEKVVFEKKSLIIDKNLAGDVDNLASLLKKISGRYRYGNDFTLNGLQRAIAEVLTRFSIYRTYTTSEGVLDSDRPYIKDVIEAAKEQSPLLINELDFIEKLLLLEYDSFLTQIEKDQWLYFVMRMQQYTGPLMAKGVEDTAFYVYNRLISLNEVGGEPDRFGITIAEFHDYNQQRQQQWSHAMSATSSHDTKRGEDVRARLNVLSEIPDEWQQHLQTWIAINRDRKTKVKNVLFPDRNDEYALYQILVGAFPFLKHEQEGFTTRVKDYLLKAIREAKVYTAWLRPNATYEDACMRFVEAVLDPSSSNQFLESLLPFQQKIAFYGVLNSLSQVLLKITSPGCPDFYQGCELWDLSLVDPDNRRPVDFEQRAAFLTDIQHRIQTDLSSLVVELLETKEDGRIKLFLVLQALKARTKYLSVFQEGSYQPLEVVGAQCDRVIAFARQQEHTSVITVVPRFLTTLVQPGEYPLGNQIWADTTIKLPAQCSSAWHDLITGQSIEQGGDLRVGELLNQFPVALLTNATL